MQNNRYLEIWLIFVNIKAISGYDFNELISSGDNGTENYIGAWANVLIKSETIDKALAVLPKALRELSFEIVFIDKIENVMSLIEYKELKDDVITEVDWLLASNYLFMISDAIFPYAKEND